MLRANQTVPLTICWPNIEIRQLRAKLILEECLETVAALGFQLRYPLEDASGTYLGILDMDRIEVTRSDNQPKGTPADIAEVADGCADIKVVTTGTLSAFGIADSPLQALVDDNNLAKFGPGCSFREDGKVIKPPTHRPPDIVGLLFPVTFNINPTNVIKGAFISSEPDMWAPEPFRKFGQTSPPLGHFTEQIVGPDVTLDPTPAYQEMITLPANDFPLKEVYNHTV